MISGKKLGGILTEGVTRGEITEIVVVRNRLKYKWGRISKGIKGNSNIFKKRICKRI